MPSIPTTLKPRIAPNPSSFAKARSKPYAPTPPAIPTSTSSPGFKVLGSYKTITRRWLGIIVGFPIVVVTSFVLYQRVFLGKEQTPLMPEEGQYPDLVKAFVGIERKPTVSTPGEGQHADDG